MSALKLVPLTEHLAAELAAGKHGSEGDNFPTVREIGERFSVSPVTALRAVRALRDRGLLRRAGRRMKIAVSGRGRIGRRIGVVVTQMDNPFFSRLLNELEREGARRGMEIISAGSSYDVGRERRILAMLADSGADGFLVCPAHDVDSASALNRLKLPFVLIGRLVAGVEASCVEVDNFRAGMLAAEHLVSCGCRDFFYVGGANFIRDERCDGFAAGLRERGQRLEPERILHPDSERHREVLPELLRKLHRGRPAGVFCYHDLWALRVLRAAHLCRLKVPSELAVIGMDDLPIASETLPSLSSVAYPLRLIASGAFDLLNALEEGDANSRRRILLEPGLVVRGSTLEKQELWR